jgi:hypothetical protein
LVAAKNHCLDFEPEYPAMIFLGNHNPRWEFRSIRSQREVRGMRTDNHNFPAQENAERTGLVLFYVAKNRTSPA